MPTNDFFDLFVLISSLSEKNRVHTEKTGGKITKSPLILPIIFHIRSCVNLALRPGHIERLNCGVRSLTDLIYDQG